MVKRSAAEIIAMHFCADIADVRDSTYQNYRPTVYTVGDDYYCCPPAGQKPPRTPPGGPWHPLAEYYGRTIYLSEMEGA
jgi:hypothetical protein